MVKSCAPVFVLIFAFAFRLEQPTPSLVYIISLIGIGVVLTVWDAFDFHFWGFILVFGATIMSGFRWTLTQLIIESGTTQDLDEETELAGSGPLRTMLFLAPVIGSTLLLLSMLVEGPKTVANSVFFADWHSGMRSFAVCVVGGVQAFILILLEYKVVQETSVLTFSISGIVKELLTIGLSMWLFGDRVKIINMVGATVSIIGIFCYNLYKIRSKRTKGGDPDSRRRRTEAAVQNIFIALPTTEPAWMLDRMEESDESIDTVNYFWSAAPRPSPTESAARDQEGRHSSYGGGGGGGDTSPLKELKKLRQIQVGGSLRSSRNSSPIRTSQAANQAVSPIELRSM